MVQVLLQILLLAVGFAFLVKGADWFVDGAAKLAAHFGIPQIVIGLTIVAMGTSLPETSVSLTSAIKDAGDITVGNVLGSNIANILLILGVSPLFRDLPVDKRTMRFEMPFLLFVTLLMPMLGLFDGVISLADGLILMVLMVVYLLYLRLRAKEQEAKQSELDTSMSESESKETPMWKMLLLIVVGVALIIVGSEFAVDAATELARMAGVSERIIGLTIVAIGTSLPELVTSVAAAIRGETDIAIGNIVGSNIFNVLFVTGVTAVLVPVDFQQAFLRDSIVAAAAVVLFIACLLPKKRLGKLSGALMLVCYIAYVLQLIFSGSTI